MPLNPGHLPDEAKGKQVRLRFNNGRVAGAGKEGFAGYPANTCKWEQRGEDWDIAEYEVIQ